MKKSIVWALFALGLIGATTSAEAVDCARWNTQMFFERATVNYVVACLNAGANPNARNEIGTTPLHQAALFSGNLEIITELLNAGADPNAQREDGATPLHWAAAASWDPAVVDELLYFDADPNAQDEGGELPIHLAARWNENLTVIERLAWFLNFDTPNKRGMTSLHVAAQSNKNPAVIEELLNAGANPGLLDKDGNTPLDYARDNSALVGSDAYLWLQDQ